MNGMYPQLPVDHEAERYCLGLWMSGDARRVMLARNLDAAWFSHAGRADAHRAAQEADSAGLEITAEEVGRRMTWQANQTAIIGEMVDCIGIGSDEWVARLRRAWRRREIWLATEAMMSAASQGDDVDGALAAMRTRIDAANYQPKRETWAEVVARVAAARVGGTPAVERIPTHLRPLDARLGGGFGRGWLIVLMAGPKTGKTALAVNNIVGGVCSDGGAGLVISREMSVEELAERALTARADGAVAADHVMRAADEMAGWRLTVDDRSASLDAVKASARAATEEHGKLDVVVVDYLQLLTAGVDNRTLDLETLVTGLKGLARELDAPVVLLVQPDKASRQKGRLGSSDAKGSGAPEEAADLLLLMERPNQVESPREIHIRWPSFRHGPAGQLVDGEVYWDSRSLTVKEAM